MKVACSGTSPSLSRSRSATTGAVFRSGQEEIIERRAGIASARDSSAELLFVARERIPCQTDVSSIVSPKRARR